MGNVCSEAQLCDCACTRATRSSAGGRKTEGNLVRAQTSSESLSDEKKVFGESKTRNRTRSLSLGDALVMNNGLKSGDRGIHKYNLRSRAKEGRALGTNSSVAKSLSCHVPPCSSSVDTQLLLVTSLEKLSLSVGTTNEISKGGKRNPQSIRLELEPNLIDNSLEEDIQELPKHVLYYGWFFKEKTSITIHSAVMHFFRLCYNQVPQFQRFMQTCCKDADVREPFEYYKRPGKRVKPDDPLEYHITAKFLGRLPDIPYQTLVHPFIGKTFYLHLIGIVFTPRTLGVRVKLTPAQQLIFDEKDESRSGLKTSSNPSLKVPDIRKKLEMELDSYKRSYKGHKKAFPNCKLKAVSDGETAMFRKIPQEPTTITPKSRAHITIGCAPNVQAKQTGDDLVDLVDLEQRTATSTGNSNFQQDFKVDRGVLRQFGKHANAFILYADTEMIVPGNFNVFI